MSSPEERSFHYGNCGRILAGTANYLGYPVGENITEGWGHTMSRLAEADDMSERDPEAMDAPELLEFLGINSPNTQLLNAAANLIGANQHGLMARTLRQHFNGRVLEALSTLDLLRYQSDKAISSADDLWERLGSITIVSSHLDAFTDSKEDAMILPQFTAGQLARGGLVRMVTSAARVRPSTSTAFFKAIKEFPDTGSAVMDRIRNASFSLQATPEL